MEQTHSGGCCHSPGRDVSDVTKGQFPEFPEEVAEKR